MKKFYIYFLVQFLFLALSTNATGYHGVFAGINDYPGTSSDLSYCVKDAEDIRYWFIHKKNWLSENCALKLNSDADEWDIRNAIQAMPNNNNNNNVFTFSGHGDSYQLGGYDGLIPANSFYARITPSEIQTWFGYNYNQYANFLDACGSGVFPDNMGKGVICSACKANEYALESGSIQHGYYSYYVIQALKQNSIKTAEAIHNYAAPRTTSASPGQHPQMKDNYPGNLNIYRNTVLSVYITGPSYLNGGETGTWTAHPSGGQTPYHYQWEYYIFCDGIENFGDIEPDAVPCGYWFDFGSDSPTASRSDWRSFKVKVTVTDANNSTAVAYKTVSVGGNAPQSDGLTTQIVGNIIPSSTKLGSNYPNPFNPSTNISYQLKNSGFVSLKIYDVLGKEISTLVYENKPAGYYNVSFNANNLPSGVYIYRLNVNNYTESKKMLLAK